MRPMLRTHMLQNNRTVYVEDKSVWFEHEPSDLRGSFKVCNNTQCPAAGLTMLKHFSTVHESAKYFPHTSPHETGNSQLRGFKPAAPFLLLLLDPTDTGASRMHPIQPIWIKQLNKITTATSAGHQDTHRLHLPITYIRSYTPTLTCFVSPCASLYCCSRACLMRLPKPRLRRGHSEVAMAIFPSLCLCAEPMWVNKTSAQVSRPSSRSD